MEFLKDILGDDLYKQVETKVNEANAKITDKDSQIKIVNVSNGEYVSKSKYTALEADLSNTRTSLNTANNTIADLKKNNKDNADLQDAISKHEATIKTLETQHKTELAKMAKQSAIKEALYGAKAKHPDLLLSKFDLDKIVLNDDKSLTGLDEQFKSVKETYKDLFEENNPNNAKQPYSYTPNNPNGGNAGTSADFVSIIKENQVKR